MKEWLLIIIIAFMFLSMEGEQESRKLCEGGDDFPRLTQISTTHDYKT